MLGARDVLLPHQIRNPELSSQTEMGITKTDKVKSCSWSRTVIGQESGHEMGRKAEQ